MSVQSVLKSKFQFEINSAIKADAWVYILGSTSQVTKKAELKKIAERHGHTQQLKLDKRVVSFVGQNGPVWILQNTGVKKGTHQGLLDESLYAWFRDHSGGLVSHFKAQQLEKIELNFHEASETIIRASIIGLELAGYNFLNSYNNVPIKKPLINLVLTTKKKNFKLDKKQIEKYQVEAASIQLARHLVNLPPNDINPKTFETLIKKELGFPKSLKVEVWDHNKLLSENMNLHLAVGKGSETPPCMVHIKYRPKKKSTKRGKRGRPTAKKKKRTTRRKTATAMIETVGPTLPS